MPYLLAKQTSTQAKLFLENGLIHRHGYYTKHRELFVLYFFCLQVTAVINLHRSVPACMSSEE